MNTKPRSRNSIVVKSGHPHTEGLVAEYLFNDSDLTILDWAKNGNDLSIVGGAEISNEGLVVDANGEYASFDNNAQVVNSSVGTIIFSIKSNSIFSDGVGRWIFGKFGGAWAAGDFSLYKNSSTPSYIIFLFHSGAGVHYVRYPAANFTNWDTQFNQISISWDQNNAIYNSLNMAVSYNGQFLTPDANSGATSWGTFTVAQIMAFCNDYSATTSFMNGVIERSSIYNRSLAEDELLSIYEKPYDKYLSPFVHKKIAVSYAGSPHEKKETLVLNESHSHAQNLVAAYPFKKCYDLRYSFNHDFSTKNNVLDTQPLAINSEGIYCGNFADYSYLNNANEPLSIDEGTIVIEFTNYISKTLQCLFGRYAVSGAGDFTMMKYSDNNFYFLINDGSGDHYVYINLSKIPNWNIDFTQIAILWRRTSAIWNSDNMVINIDGVHQVPDGQLNETSWNTGSLASVSYYIGNNSADANQYASGPIRRCYMYNTVLTEAELLSIKNAPDAMFKN